MSLRILIARVNIYKYSNIKRIEIEKTFEFNGQILTFKKMSVIEDKYTLYIQDMIFASSDPSKYVIRLLQVVSISVSSFLYFSLIISFLKR